MKQVEILYFDSCLTWQLALEAVHKIVAEAHVGDRVGVRLVRVSSDEEAHRLRFLGSPTVRVDGLDVEPTSRSLTTYGLQCRLYASNGRTQRVPPAEMIRAALGLGAGGET